MATKQGVSVTLYWQLGRKGEPTLLAAWGKGGPTLLAAWWEGRAHYTCTVVGREGGSHSSGSVAVRLPLSISSVKVRVPNYRGRG
jgi:hypothetical protein